MRVQYVLDGSAIDTPTAMVPTSCVKGAGRLPYPDDLRSPSSVRIMPHPRLSTSLGERYMDLPAQLTPWPSESDATNTMQATRHDASILVCVPDCHVAGHVCDAGGRGLSWDIAAVGLSSDIRAGSLREGGTVRERSETPRDLQLLGHVAVYRAHSATERSVSTS